MSLADFDRIDIVARDPDGGQRYLLVAGQGWPVVREAQQTVQVMIKVGRLEPYAAQQREGGVAVALELISPDEPPAGVVAWLAARGVTSRVGDGLQPARGRPSPFALREDGSFDLDALMEVIAYTFAGQHHLPLPPDLAALDRVDALLEERRAQSGLQPEDADEEAADGDLEVQAGAYVGEAIRAAAGGEWAFQTDLAYLRPVYLRTGPPGGYQVNVLGKVNKYLRYGSGDSLAGLARAVLDMARTPG